MKKKDIQGLVQRSIQGDKAAFGRVCEAVAKDVLFMCIKIMGHQQDGEDAAQEVFVKMQRSIGSLKNPDVFHIWINRIIISACNDIRRKKVRQKDYVPIEDHLDAIVEDNQDFLPLEYVEDADKKEVLMQVIDSLPEQYRKVVLLYYSEGLSQAGIAPVL